MNFLRQTLRHPWVRVVSLSVAALGVLTGVPGRVPDALASASLLVSQTPLTVEVPSHPQVLIAVGNSQSMDGNLSGAIMTGSGLLSSAMTSLYSSSSPQTFQVQSGFVPPLQAANSSGYASYTVPVSTSAVPYTYCSSCTTLADNSDSRLNMAKQGIAAILNAYMTNTDFALETYSTGSLSSSAVNTTWVYYMSPMGSNFTFTNTQVTGNRYVINPCYNYTNATSSVKTDCTAIANLYGSSTLAGSQYMQIGASSDDPSINDVLYASGLVPVFVEYNGPNKSTPYPPNFTLSQYETGGVVLTYGSSQPSGYAFGTSPTNAGYVPYSPQVMNVQRGFGYYNYNQPYPSATSGTIVVPMTTAGSTPTTTSINTAIAAFTKYLQPETNKYNTAEIKAVATQSPLAGLLKQAKSYLSDVTSSSSTCPAKKYVVLVTDGLPTYDLDGHSWPPLGSAAATGYSVTATFNADGSLNTTNDQALTDTIGALVALKNAGINTYIIGLGAGVEPSINPTAAATLTAMAIAGGTQNYYAASSAAALVSDLNTILISIQSGSMATSSAAVNSTELSTGNYTYQSMFTTSDSPYQDWTGDLVARSLVLSTSGTVNETKLWSAQCQLDILIGASSNPGSSGTAATSCPTAGAETGNGTSRYIATWNPVSGAGVPFEWGNISTSQQGELQPSDTLGSNRIAYLHGNTSNEVRNGGTFRNRSHILGDIVFSQPLYVGAPNGPYSSTSSYLTFEQNESAGGTSVRPAMVYVGANDGMLHAFSASNGNEMFAYVPNGVFANLYNLTSTTYNQSHLFFVDGSPNSGDVQFSDGSWHTVLAGGENAGGNSIYALDITNPQAAVSESALASKVLWEFSDGDMGLSYSQPQIAPIATAVSTSMSCSQTSPPANCIAQNYAVFFGNGYNSPNNNAVLYVLNPQTGAQIAKINLCTAFPAACNTSLPEGLSTVVAANSNGLIDQPVTTVYAGDLQGNLWAVDVYNSNPTNWTVRWLFEARDASGTPQPITTQPQVTLNPNYPTDSGLMVLFGTGQLLQNSDLSTTSTQTAYAVWDAPNATLPMTRSNLEAQSLTQVPGSTSGYSQPIYVVTNNSVNWASQYGWYADLPVGGQRFVVNPAVYNQTFQATLNTPPSNICNGGFTSMFLDLSYLNGGATSTGQIGTFNSQTSAFTPYSYNGLNAVAVGLTSGFGSGGVIMTGSGSAQSTAGTNASGLTAGYYYVLITLPNGTHYYIQVPSNQVPRSAWWQIQ